MSKHKSQHKGSEGSSSSMIVVSSNAAGSSILLLDPNITHTHTHNSVISGQINHLSRNGNKQIQASDEKKDGKLVHCSAIFNFPCLLFFQTAQLLFFAGDFSWDREFVIAFVCVCVCAFRNHFSFSPSSLSLPVEQQTRSNETFACCQMQIEKSWSFALRSIKLFVFITKVQQRIES